MGLKYDLVQVLIALVVLTLGLWLFAAHGDFITTHANVYYLWDKVKDFCLMFSLSLFLKGRLKRVTLSVSAFLLIRIVWQIWELENYESANKPYVIDWLFILLIVSILFNVYNFNPTKKRNHAGN